MSIREAILALKAAAEREGEELSGVTFDSWPRLEATLVGILVEGKGTLLEKLAEELTMRPIVEAGAAPGSCVIDGWTIGKDARGFFAHDPRGPSTVRLTTNGDVYVLAHDGGCTIPAKVMGTLESLVGCTCNPLEQTGGVHRSDCPAWQPEWETVR